MHAEPYACHKQSALSARQGCRAAVLALRPGLTALQGLNGEAACPRALGRTTMQAARTRRSLYPSRRFATRRLAGLVGFVVRGRET